MANVKTIVIVEGFLRGHEDGNDILTLSLGGASGWAASTSAVVASRIANTGTIVTIAAGNDVCRPLVHVFFEAEHYCRRALQVLGILQAREMQKMPSLLPALTSAFLLLFPLPTLTYGIQSN